MPTVQEVQSVLQYLKGQAPSEQAALQAMVNYANANNISNEMLSAASGFAPNGQWSPEKVAAVRAQYPSYGLGGSMSTLTQGGQAATDRIDQTQGMVSDLFKQGLNRLDPYMQTGVQANQLQAALSGALGPEAQAKAFAEYRSSPGVDFLREQGERATLRNASALGGVGGGNVRAELNRQGIGYAMQDFGNQFNRIGQVADRGFGASSQGASFGPQEASIQANLGQFAANIPLQIAQAQAGMQFQAGRDLSSNIGGTTSALANLLNQQGQGAANMIGGQAANLGNTYMNGGQSAAQGFEGLGSGLAGVGMQGAGYYTGTPTVNAPQTNYLGQAGQLAGGIGGILSAFPQGQSQPTGVNTAFNTNPGYGPSYTGAYNPGIYLAGL